MDQQSSSSPSLPDFSDLIRDSWHFFTSTWNKTFETSRLFIGVGGLYFLMGVLPVLNPSLIPLSGALLLVGIILIFWITLRMISRVLLLESGKDALPAAEESKKAWSLFFSGVWIGILTFFAILGGSLLFILPGIYLSICFQFAQFILVEQNVRGTKALSASRALVKGRWWGTFGRMLAGGIVFGILIGIINQILSSIVFALFPALTTDEALVPLFVGITHFISMLVTAPFLSLVLGFQVKLFRALQKTR